MPIAPRRRRWCEFRLWKLLVLLAVVGSIVWLKSPFFPWNELRDALPRASLGEILILAIAGYCFALARDAKLDAKLTGECNGEPYVVWIVCQVLCAAFMTLALFFIGFQMAFD